MKSTHLFQKVLKGGAIRASRNLQVKAMASPAITHTRFEGNSFKVTFNTANVTVLVDPWLSEEDMVFAEQTWLYRGRHTAKLPPFDEAAKCDLLVLSQSLDDHAHKPTLRRLSKSLPVVCSTQAVPLVKELGFTNIISVDHGQTVSVLSGRLTITGTRGALVGPPWSKRENGYLFAERGGARVYYEPHCDFDAASVASVAPADVVISPVKTQGLGVGDFVYPLVMGSEQLVPLLKILRPKALLPLLNAEFDMEGPLSAAITTKGSVDEVPAKLKAAGLTTRLVVPAPPGAPQDVALEEPAQLAA